MGARGDQDEPEIHGGSVHMPDIVTPGVAQNFAGHAGAEIGYAEFHVSAN